MFYLSDPACFVVVVVVLFCFVFLLLFVCLFVCLFVLVVVVRLCVCFFVYLFLFVFVLRFSVPFDKEIFPMRNQAARPRESRPRPSHATLFPYSFLQSFASPAVEC